MNQALLTIDNMQANICNGKQLSKINLQIYPHDVIGILGPNGSGKTSMLHLLAGLNTPASGRLQLNGKDFHQYSIRARAKKIGLLFQDNLNPFPQTVWDYCLSARFPHLGLLKRYTDQDKQLAYQALCLIELQHKALQMTLTLSGGEKRRLALASLLTQNPQIYLLDEPTNHLDLHHQIKILDHFKSLALLENTAVMMVLHDINFAERYCNRIVMIFSNGEIIQGPKEKILTSGNLTKLFQHPMHQIPYCGKYFWQPAIDNVQNPVKLSHHLIYK